MQRDFPFAFGPAEGRLCDSASVIPRGATAASARDQPKRLDGVEVVTLHGFDLEDRPIVSGISALPGELVPCRSTVPLYADMAGGQVLVAFERGDPHLPVALGVMKRQACSIDCGVEPPALVRVDSEERLVLRAEREIVFQCGDASITLTRVGKVVIRGRYILSWATGYNKIKGAAVDIN